MKNFRRIALITFLEAVMAAIPAPAMRQAAGSPISPDRLAAGFQRASFGLRGGWHAEGLRPERGRDAPRVDSDTPASTVESSVELARRAWTRFDYKKALDLLDEAAQNAPDSPHLLAAYGSLYLKAEESGRARHYLDRAVKLNPDCPEALLGEAEAQFLDRDYSGAERWLNRLLSKDQGQNTTVSCAYALLARIRIETGNRVLAAAEAARALDTDPQNANALYITALLNSAQRKPALVRSLARRALEIDPFLAGARRLLAQYLNGSAGYLQKVDVAALNHFEKGKQFEERGDTRDALAEFGTAVTVEPRYYRALIALAGIKLSAREYKDAISAATRALETDPEGAIANMQLAYAQVGLSEEARAGIGATDYTACFYGQGATQSAGGLLRLVFPDYDKLDARGRFVLGRSVAGLACFLPRLASASARHYLLRLDQRISDCPEFRDMRDRTTFDGRYYASIRGVGGRIALSGVEYLDEASRGGFNGIAHEFAHQVQETAMAPEELAAIHSLYQAATRQDRTLDYYAGANEFEYFAAGYEAFVSTFKRPAAGLTARHTRDELKTRDPGLYNLLTKMAEKSAQVARD